MINNFFLLLSIKYVIWGCEGVKHAEIHEYNRIKFCIGSWVPVLYVIHDC